MCMIILIAVKTTGDTAHKAVPVTLDVSIHQLQTSGRLFHIKGLLFDASHACRAACTGLANHGPAVVCSRVILFRKRCESMEEHYHDWLQA